MIFQKAKGEKVKKEKTSIPEAPTTSQSFMDGPMFGPLGIPGDSVVKNPPAKARDVGLIPGSGRSPGEGNGNPLQDSCLENPKDRGVWQATVPGVARVGHLATKPP